MTWTRRGFIASSALGAAALAARPSSTLGADIVRSPNERARLGAIGLRYQGSVITEKALPYGDVVAVCDVDRHVREQARAAFGSRAAVIEDYRKLLDRKDIDVVLIGTPDHWHTKMVIDACRAGKDIYVEKPLTLTIDEGKLLTKVVQETGRIVQVGTWQRSDVRFRHACEMVRGGKLGTLKRVVATIDANPAGGPFENGPTPKHLNWDLWLGQAPKVPYCEERGHYTFRWWYEYSGGKMTDWGAHHIDIAQWGIGADRSGPTEIDGTATMPSVENGYNTPTAFHAKMKYGNGVELEVRSKGKIGVLFEGERGSIFVTRGSIESNPPEILKEESIERSQYGLYAYDLTFKPKVGKLESIENHMQNFFNCVRDREQPISDVVSQHRSVSVCHLANISMRLGQPLKWDPESETFPGSAAANAWLAREQRKGFELLNSSSQQRLDRRQFIAAGIGTAAAASLAWSEKPAFELHYILASAMYGTMPLSTILPEVKKTGAESIDIWPRVHGNQREQIAEMGPSAFARMLDDEGIRLGGIACYKPGPFNLDSEIELCRQCGQKDVVLVCGARGGKGLRGAELKKAVNDFVEKMKPVVEKARAADCIVAIENHSNDLLESPEAIRLFGETIEPDGLGMALAPHHLPQDAALIADLVRTVGPGIKFVYAQQHGKGSSKKLPKEEEMLQMPGRGPLDFTPILAALAEINFQGPTEIFMHPVPRGIPILDTAAAITEEINRSRQYLEGCLQKARQS